MRRIKTTVANTTENTMYDNNNNNNDHIIENNFNYENNNNEESTPMYDNDGFIDDYSDDISNIEEDTTSNNIRHNGDEEITITSSSDDDNGTSFDKLKKQYQRSNNNNNNNNNLNDDIILSYYNISADGTEFLTLVSFLAVSIILTFLSMSTLVLFMSIMIMLILYFTIYLYNPFRSNNIYVCNILMIYWFIVSFGYHTSSLHSDSYYILEYMITIFLYGGSIFLTWINGNIIESRLKVILILVLIFNIVPLSMSNAFHNVNITILKVILLIIEFSLINIRLRLRNMIGRMYYFYIYINIQYILFGHIWVVLLLFIVSILKEIMTILDDYKNGRMKNTSIGNMKNIIQNEQQQQHQHNNSNNISDIDIMNNVIAKKTRINQQQQQQPSYTMNNPSLIHQAITNHNNMILVPDNYYDIDRQLQQIQQQKSKYI